MRLTIFAAAMGAALLWASASGGTDYGGCISNSNSFHNQEAHQISRSRQLNGGDDLEGMDSIGLFAPSAYVAAGAIRDGTTNTIMTGEMQRLWGELDAGGDWSHRSHDGWAVGGVANLFTTTVLPTTDVAANPGGINNGFYESPGSDHVSGAHFGLADGSVHFFSQHADPLVLRDMGSRAGGEVVQLP